MKTLRKWWKAAFAVLLALIALQVAVSLAVRTDRARAFLTRQLEKSFGRTVDVRQYSVTLFPTPELDANSITIGEDPAFGQEYFLRAERLSAGLRWTGLLRGRFELGTLQLQRPSLILVRNSEGRWNLERWLPAANTDSPRGRTIPNAAAQATPAHLLRKIEISDGRANFKVGDDKTPFAFMEVEGSVEQTATGRWRLDLTAEPWRSGVPLQLAGTVRVRGEVAGTSSRLQPAHLQISWEKSSLADVFRLIAGQDFGVRGLFSGEAIAESGDNSSVEMKNAVPGDWMVSLQARATGIHRWDLTERDDNPRVGVRVKARWNPGTGTANADEVLVESPRSNLRGTGSLKSIAASNLELRVDSSGLQAADILDWYRAFHPYVSDDIRANQYFTGAAVIRGWPISITDAAFSSSGGDWTVPGFDTALRVRAVRGGIQRRKLVIEPFGVNVPGRKVSGLRPRAPAQAHGDDGSPTGADNVSISMMHDFATKDGGIRILGQVTRVEDVLAIAGGFGKRLENGWELKGKASSDLHWEWSADRIPVWNGQADVSAATLQLAGLNQPVQLGSVHGEWRNAHRKFTLGKVIAFGASWTGSVEQTAVVPNEVAENDPATWSFQLQADHLDAAELDRWIGPRARPGWLQRLLQTRFSGAASTESPSALLRRIRADGELRVDELTIEKMKLKQFRAQAKLGQLKLSVRNIHAQWANGEIQGGLEASFSAKPRYEIVASFDHVAIAQAPWLAKVSERLAGTASGSAELHAEGIGRESLLNSLSGKGDLRLANVELRGWDLPVTMALGEWKTGVSRWATGAGTFHLSDGGFELNSLRLVSASEEFLLKGSVSNAAEAELTGESHGTGKVARTENTVRFLSITGPITEPKVSLEKNTAQQPGD